MHKYKSFSSDCTGCVYKNGEFCTVNPPIPVQIEYYEESDHPMLSDRLVRKTEYKYPQATFRCRFYTE